MEKAELERLLAESIDQITQMERTIPSLYYHEELTLRELPSWSGCTNRESLNSSHSHPEAARAFVRRMAVHARGASGMRSLQALEAARSLVDRWVENLAQVVESLMEQRPSVAWTVLDSRRPRDLAPYGRIGFEDSRARDVRPRRNKEHVVRNRRPMAVRISPAGGSHLGHDVTGEPSVDPVPEAQNEWLLVSLRFGETELPPLAVSFAPPLLGLLTSPAAESGEAKTAMEAAEAPTAAQAGRGASPQNSDAAPASRTMDLLSSWNCL